MLTLCRDLEALREPTRSRDARSRVQMLLAKAFRWKTDILRELRHIQDSRFTGWPSSDVSLFSSCNFMH